MALGNHHGIHSTGKRHLWCCVSFLRRGDLFHSFGKYWLNQCDLDGWKQLDFGALRGEGTDGDGCLSGHSEGDHGFTLD